MTAGAPFVVDGPVKPGHDMVGVHFFNTLPATASSLAIIAGSRFSGAVIRA